MALIQPELIALARIRIGTAPSPVPPEIASKSAPSEPILAPESREPFAAFRASRAFSPTIARAGGPMAPGPLSHTASYEFSNGFDAIEVQGAPGAPPIYFDTSSLPGRYVIFLSNPNEIGNSSIPSEGGIKAIFNVVAVSTPSNPRPLPFTNPSGFVYYQYGNYNLGTTPYKNVNPQKVLAFAGKFRAGALVDVSVFKNPMALYK